MSTVKDLGMVTAYAYAVSEGYTGTEEEFAELMASYATVAEQAEASATAADGSAKDSEAYAVGKRGGTDVGSSDPAYHNNAKYYANQAGGSATTASTKAGEAAQSASDASGYKNTAVDKAAAASADALKAEGYAVGKQNGSDVASGSTYYHNNAKYYSEQASGDATTASTQAGLAAGSATAAETAQGKAETAQGKAETAQGKAEDAQAAAEAAAEQAEATLESYAKVDGSYSSMTVGNAEQLVATVGVEDSVPYNFRTSGGSADIGDREVDTVVGGTIAWNQLNKIRSISWTDYHGISFTKVSDTTVKVTGVASSNSNARMYACPNIFPPNHVYLLDGFDSHIGVRIGNATDKISPCIGKPTTSTESTVIGYIRADTDFGDGVEMTPQVFDLTQMFGTTIADYIYTLETATPGAGVAWFRKLFPKPYYAYNAGTLMSVKAARHVMRGFNAWDEQSEKGSYNVTTGAKQTDNSNLRCVNPIPVVPNTTYYFRQATATSNGLLFYDAAGNYIGYLSRTGNNTFTTPENAHYMTFYLSSGYGTTYNHDITINLHWDGERDGEYEPYVEYAYPLGDVELRGIPKLDASNNLYYDGDVYEADGTVTRKYGVIDLGTVDWYYNSGYTVFTSIAIQNIKYDVNGPNNVICPKYLASPVHSSTSADKTVYTRYVSDTTSGLGIKDSDYTDAAAFKAAMSGVYLVYELDTPTTEESDPFQSPQIVDDFGTEEYVDAGVTAQTPTRDVAIPVGHNTTYQANLRAKLEMAPDSPDGDGDYIVRQTNGLNEYVALTKELPAAPTTEGTYHLKATVTSGGVTLTWEADT